ncbi:hypothetical protein B0H14DRAFT_2646058 [Mycena olivaceomarginata]|nr:hypothetical protein B0H14DRAFT_2646058 [Mycena olivaceomarginata]
MEQLPLEQGIKFSEQCKKRGDGHKNHVVLLLLGNDSDTSSDDDYRPANVSAPVADVSAHLQRKSRWRFGKRVLDVKVLDVNVRYRQNEDAAKVRHMAVYNELADVSATVLCKCCKLTVQTEFPESSIIQPQIKPAINGQTRLRDVLGSAFRAKFNWSKWRDQIGYRDDGGSCRRDEGVVGGPIKSGVCPPARMWSLKLVLGLTVMDIVILDSTTFYLSGSELGLGGT